MAITRRTALTGAASLVLPVHAQAAQTPPTPQPPGFFRHQIGDIEATIVTDGTGTMPIDGLVVNAPVTDVRRALTDAFLPSDKFLTSYNTLVLRIAGRTIAFDTGNGDTAPASAGHWLTNLAAAGIPPEEVDVVVLTHFHPDHINGFRHKDGTTPLPKAQVMAPQPEWAFWMDDARVTQAGARPKSQVANVHRVLDPVANTIVLFDWGKEILPGVTALAAPGHTPGHTVFSIASGNDQMLWMVDTTNNPDLLLRHPDMEPVFDVDPELARQTRHRLADMAAADRTLVGFYHASFPALGHVERASDGFRLVPATWIA